MAPEYFGNDDLTAIFLDARGRGMAADVSIAGGEAIPGIVDYVGRDVLQSLNISGVSGVVITVTVQTSALPSPPLRNRTAFTLQSRDKLGQLVGSPQALILRDSQQEGDGALTHLFGERS